MTASSVPRLPRAAPALVGALLLVTAACPAWSTASPASSEDDPFARCGINQPTPTPPRGARLQVPAFAADGKTARSGTGFAQWSLECTLHATQALARDYGARSERARRWNLALQMPVVGLGAGAADTLLRENTRTGESQASTSGVNQPLRTLGQLAIAATAFVATRNILLPRGRDLLLLQGWAAGTCLIFEAQPFVGLEAEGAQAALTNARGAAAQALVALDAQIRALEGSQLTAAQTRLFEARKAHARVERELVEPLVERAGRELAAWETRGIVFARARMAVETRVETRLRDVPTIDFREFVEEALKAGTPPKADTQAQTAEGQKAILAKELDAGLDRLATLIGDLAMARTSLAAAMRPYEEGLKRAAQCPEIVKAS